MIQPTTQTLSPHQITHEGQLLAMIIPHTYTQPGVNFFTPNTFSQQLAYMNHPEGHTIAAHSHNPLPRKVTLTQEVLILRKGRLRVDFYDTAQTYLKSVVLEAGDIILLAAGGHGFQVLEEVEMIEVKQGPFSGIDDKRRFPGVLPDQVQIIHWPTN
ncbi:MAG: hypothetical protein KKD63_02025 [Proteobacteria bacterium]|nr:hypothetical protein [Desulfobulbaceae bacterium]MBU4151638.1 hypothetical protein [Pseudomonadota bacterium]